jgi:hypothetical protein
MSPADDMPEWKKSPADLRDSFAAALDGFPEAQRRQMFGYPAAFANGNMWTGPARRPPARTYQSTRRFVQRMPQWPPSTLQLVARNVPSARRIAVGKPNWKSIISSTPSARWRPSRTAFAS